MYTEIEERRDGVRLQRVNLKQLLCRSFPCYPSSFSFLSSLLISAFLLKDQSLPISETANLTLWLIHEVPGFVREPYVEQSAGLGQIPKIMTSLRKAELTLWLN